MEERFAALKTAQEIRDLKGDAFEEYLRQLFSDLGYRAKKTPSSRDGGADLIIERDGKRVAVQAKSYKNAVGYNAAQEIHAGRTIYDAEYAAVVTTSYFTPDAKRRAKQLNVDLFDGKALEKLARKACSRNIGQNDDVTVDSSSSSTSVSGHVSTPKSLRTSLSAADSHPVSSQIQPKTVSLDAELPSRIRMRRLSSWERVRRTIDYSYKLPNCWLPGINKIERSRRLLLVLAAILLAAPGRSMTLEAIRCQLPSSVSEDELHYILHSIPLYKVRQGISRGARDAVEHYAVDSDFVSGRYEITYKKLDEAIAQLICAIEGLPQGLLSFANGRMTIPPGYAYAKDLDGAVLQKAILLGYIAQFTEPHRVVYIPLPAKSFLFYEDQNSAKPLGSEEVKKLAYDAFVEAERSYVTVPAWDLALRFHQKITAKYEQYCMNKEGPLGLCYKALYEVGGGYTDAELAEYVAKMQGISCTDESTAFLRKNCLESDSLISRAKMFHNGGWDMCYFLTFQVGIDGLFLMDYVARMQALQAQIASFSAQIDALSRQRNEMLEGLAAQQVRLANALGAKAYANRNEKRSMRESLSFLELKINEVQKSDAITRQRASASLSEELSKKQAELNQIAQKCNSEKWRFKLS